ncbi:MAG: hypothetical protein O2923_06790 [Verrucomicrobia bacterium]|nr:hypothetical protein [Verrucomicrobiota bacterium]MDA1087237.1 hypothetical protein [Verrucomicrobiota bacterium]
MSTRTKSCLGVNAIVMLVLVCMAICLAGPAGAAEKRFEGVVIQKSTIDGRVFIIAEEDPDTGESPDPIPAGSVRVELKDRRDKTVVAETLTDDDGRYKLEDIAPGVYKIHIGKLRLDFKVRPRSELTGDEPRVFVVLLPEDLAPSAHAKAEDR